MVNIPQSSAGVGCELLVSVRDAREAAICRLASVDWIDLKEPNLGALGCPQLAVAAEVASALAGHPRRSVALGELVQLDLPVAVELSRLFSIAKVGLSAMAEVPNWRTRLDRLASHLDSQLVPVVYADGSACGAPPADQVLHWAVQSDCPYLLVDTYWKTGRRLLDCWPVAELREFVQQAATAGVRVVLAGSLNQHDIAPLLPLQPAALAVRGAVCKQGRQSELCKERVRLWAQLVRQAVVGPPVGR